MWAALIPSSDVHREAFNVGTGDQFFTAIERILDGEKLTVFDHGLDAAGDAEGVCGLLDVQILGLAGHVAPQLNDGA